MESASFTGPNNLERRLQNAQHFQQRTGYIMGLTVLFAFSWLPLNTLNILADSNSKMSEFAEGYALAYLCAILPTLLNPLLYGYYNRPFFNAFLNLLRCTPPVSTDVASTFERHATFRASLTLLQYRRNRAGYQSMASTSPPEMSAGEGEEIRMQRIVSPDYPSPDAYPEVFDSDDQLQRDDKIASPKIKTSDGENARRGGNTCCGPLETPSECQVVEFEEPVQG